MRWRRREKHRIECGDETLDRIKHDEIERERKTGLEGLDV